MAILPLTAICQVAADSSSLKLQNGFHGKGLFDDDKIIEIKLTGNLHELLNDRKGEPKYFPINIIYKGDDSNDINVPAEAKTRGHFRRMTENCLYPPLLLHFAKNNRTSNNIFNQNYKLKLGMPCRGDEYIIHEWMVYKLYNLVTQKSFRARLVKVKLEDNKNKKPILPFYGMLLEEENQVAERNNVIAINKKLRPEQTETNSFLTMAVFEYLIGNTDWSVQYLQNIKLLAADSNAAPVTVPYDFDMSALVGSPYAKPAEELNLPSVYERRYRGYCIQNIEKFNETIALYNGLKKDIYDLYSNNPLLDKKYIKSTLKFFDEFYATINNPALLKKAFTYPCDKNGTGNVVIKGLRED